MQSYVCIPTNRIYTWCIFIILTNVGAKKKKKHSKFCKEHRPKHRTLQMSKHSLWHTKDISLTFPWCFVWCKTLISHKREDNVPHLVLLVKSSVVKGYKIFNKKVVRTQGPLPIKVNRALFYWPLLWINTSHACLTFATGKTLCRFYLFREQAEWQSF